MPDPLDDFNLRAFPPSGAIAGLMSRIDGQRGVWKAPAGTEAGLAGVRQLTVTLTDAENGVLNQLGLNCLRTSRCRHVYWGARTVTAPTTRLRVEVRAVRRLALYPRGVVVPRHAMGRLRAERRAAVGADPAQSRRVHDGLFRQGAFQGGTPDEAYFVKCDGRRRPRPTDLGIVNVLVGFAPLKPAEFVIIRIQQLAGQAQAA